MKILTVYTCFKCGNQWIAKTERPRQCSNCWSRAIASEEEIRIAAIFIKPWAYLYSGRLPPLPLPHEIILLPFSMLTYNSLLMRVRRDEEIKRRMLKALLIESGFTNEDAEAMLKKLEQKQLETIKKGVSTR